ncbi:enoyl-ACP reductase [Candidatus Marinamargulisbacteria bacterium SCGC AG-439-L15]|nr:enoyl-ACP reductase [Candidatus Marinamargulisbacteria bacterium SCGC AG-439-L15]
MYPELKTKVALVTGSGKGSGRSIAKRLAQEGCTVVINYRRHRDNAETLLSEIHDLGGSGIAIKADLSQEEKTFALFKVIKEEFGGLDILIHNAAFGVPEDILSCTGHHWDVAMTSICKSFLQMSQYASQLMSNGGRIIGISCYNQQVLPNLGAISVAKAGMEALVKQLAVSCAPQGITVNSILPGLHESASFQTHPDRQRLLKTVTEKTPHNRRLTPDDIAHTAAFLCSDQAEMIQGQCLTVDGGLSLLHPAA